MMPADRMRHRLRRRQQPPRLWQRPPLLLPPRLRHRHRLWPLRKRRCRLKCRRHKPRRQKRKTPPLRGCLSLWAQALRASLGCSQSQAQATAQAQAAAQVRLLTIHISRVMLVSNNLCSQAAQAASLQAQQARAVAIAQAQAASAGSEPTVLSKRLTFVSCAPSLKASHSAGFDPWWSANAPRRATRAAETATGTCTVVYLRSKRVKERNGLQQADLEKQQREQRQLMQHMHIQQQQLLQKELARQQWALGMPTPPPGTTPQQAAQQPAQQPAAQQQAAQQQAAQPHAVHFRQRVVSSSLSADSS